MWKGPLRILVSCVAAAALAAPSPALAGTPEDPEAIDDCGVGEITDRHDLTLPDAPWVDLCAIWLAADIEGETVQSVTVSVQVAGLLQERLGNGAWQAELRIGDCRHRLIVADDGVIGEARTWTETRCGIGYVPCGEPWETVEKVLRELGVHSSCTSANTWELEEDGELPAGAVAFGDDVITITLDPADLDGRLAADLVYGATIASVNGTSYTGLGTGDHGARSFVVDHDRATSTGRSFTLS